MLAYLILISSILFYGLIQFWPSPASAESSAQVYQQVTFFLWRFSISDEVRLLIIVTLVGALGGIVHALRSFYWYVGNRDLKYSWLPLYIIRPLVGATLAIVFYLVIRGGFFSPGATVEQTSPFGFAALAGLVGMFSEQAVLKLKELAETLLTKPKPGQDPSPQQDRADETEPDKDSESQQE
jgi:hypothetical protein